MTAVRNSDIHGFVRASRFEAVEVRSLVDHQALRAMVEPPPPGHRPDVVVLALVSFDHGRKLLHLRAHDHFQNEGGQLVKRLPCT